MEKENYETDYAVHCGKSTDRMEKSAKLREEEDQKEQKEVVVSK